MDPEVEGTAKDRKRRIRESRKVWRTVQVFFTALGLVPMALMAELFRGNFYGDPGRDSIWWLMVSTLFFLIYGAGAVQFAKDITTNLLGPIPPES